MAATAVLVVRAGPSIGVVEVSELHVSSIIILVRNLLLGHRLLNFQIWYRLSLLNHHTSWLYRRGLRYLSPRRVMRRLLLVSLYLRESHVGIPLLVDILLRYLLSHNILVVPLAPKLLLLLLLIIEPLILWILLSPLLKPFILIVLVLEYWVVLPNLLEVRRFRKVLPDVVELLRFAVALVWTLLLTMLTSTNGTIYLLLPLVLILRRLSKNLSWQLLPIFVRVFTVIVAVWVKTLLWARH